MIARGNPLRGNPQHGLAEAHDEPWLHGRAGALRRAGCRNWPNTGCLEDAEAGELGAEERVERGSREGGKGGSSQDLAKHGLSGGLNRGWKGGQEEGEERGSIEGGKGGSKHLEGLVEACENEGIWTQPHLRPTSASDLVVGAHRVASVHRVAYVTTRRVAPVKHLT